MIKDIKEVKTCPDCASQNIIHNEDKTQVICKDCGLIFEPLAPKDEAKYEKVAGLKKKK
ncbi:hypothetical protein GF351_01985 [Candidatus Woesearchaeota archaeon]|nr:hypothetical protein [Candidatus Woesearchaeota archaeon]